MNNGPHHPVVNMVVVNGAWLASVSLSDVHTGVAIASGVAVLVYTVVKTYFLIRNRGEK